MGLSWLSCPVASRTIAAPLPLLPDTHVIGIVLLGSSHHFGLLESEPLFVLVKLGPQIPFIRGFWLT